MTLHGFSTPPCQSFGIALESIGSASILRKDTGSRRIGEKNLNDFQNDLNVLGVSNDFKIQGRSYTKKIHIQNFLPLADLLFKYWGVFHTSLLFENGGNLCRLTKNIWKQEGFF